MQPDITRRRKAILRKTILIFAWAGLACSARAATVEEILKKAKEAAEKWEGYTCKFRVETASTQAKSETLGTMAYLRPVYLKTETTIKNPGAPETKTLQVTNGDVTYTETKDRGTGTVIVMKSNVKKEMGKDGKEAPPVLPKTSQQTPEQMLDQLQHLFDLKVDEKTSGEKIQDMEMDVLKGDYKKGSAEEMIRKDMGRGPDGTVNDNFKIRQSVIESLMGSVRFWIGRQDHFVHRIELSPPETPPVDKTNDPAMVRGLRPSFAGAKITTTYLDVKINPPQTPADFAYTPPPGAKIREVKQ